MPIPLKILAEKIGASIARGDGAMPVSGVASLADAAPSELSQFSSAQYLPQLEKTRAGAILAKAEPAGVAWPDSRALLLSPDPEMAFIRAIEVFYPEVPERPGIDARAVIEPDVEIGPGAHVGAYAVIRSGTRIGARAVILHHAVVGRNCRAGDDCRINANVVLYDGVILGNRVTVHSGAVLGADGFGYKFRGGKHVKFPQVGSVEIGDDVEIGANSCIDRGALGPTRIGEGTKIDNLVQISHGVTVGKHCILCGQAALAGSVVLEDYVILGGNVGVADHIVMGKGSKAGAKSGIAQDVPPGVEVFGVFADERKNAFKSLAAYRRLPELMDRIKALEKELEALRGGSAKAGGDSP